MSKSERELAVRVDVEDHGETDAEELIRLTARLRAELIVLDVQSVTSIPEGPVPESSKGVGLLAAGGLIVSFLDSQVTLQSIIDGVRLWLSRQRGQSVKLTLDGDSLELSKVNTEEQKRLIDLWVSHHSDPR